MSGSGVLEQLVAQMISAAIPNIVNEVAARVGQQTQVQAGNQAQQAFGSPTGMPGAQQPQQPQYDPQQQYGQYGGQQPQQGFMGGNPTGQQQPYQQQPVQQQYQQPGQGQVTPEMIQQLIAPLVSQDAAKQALTAEMNSMGIQNLHETPPEKLGELYQRFQQVAARFSQGGAPQQPQYGQQQPQYGTQPPQPQNPQPQQQPTPSII